MSLLDLPEEVFIIIIKKLDLSSLFNLYSTCQYARNILQIRNLVKEWHMSRCAIASAKYLKSDFFKNVASHLTVLNLSGVNDLCKTVLLPALKRSKTLISLDVSYTDIDFIDFGDMYKVCPSIKNICINFELIKHFSKSNIASYQDIFKNMENIHFVGSVVNLLIPNTVLLFLTKSTLNSLKLTIVPHKIAIPIISDEEFTALKFNELYVYFMDLVEEVRYNCVSIFRYITRLNYEIMIITNGGNLLNEMCVYATPVFKDFFKDKFDINVIDIEEYNNFLCGNMAIMIFNKETVNFDNAFFNRLHVKLKGYFPHVFDSVQQVPGPDKFEWFYTCPIVTMEPKSSSKTEPVFKKKRIANPNFTLNYDTTFKHKYRAKLSLSFSGNCANPVALSPSTEFLSKLTFLSLSGKVRYSIEFFNVLFRCCCCLVTLDVVAPSISPCFQPICRSIPLSRTLKNLRLIDRDIDFRTFFNSLSQCKSLENIHIYDHSAEATTLANPNTLFESCRNLYNISIIANMTETCTRKMARLFNDAKKAGNKPQINVSILSVLHPINTSELSYEPSMSVFNDYPIKPDHSFD